MKKLHITPSLYRIITFFFLLLSIPLVSKAAGVDSTYLLLPAEIDGKTYKLETVIYRPLDNASHPLIIINHGRAGNAEARKNPKLITYYRTQAETLAQKGFIVATPARRGYGRSEGEDFERSSTTTSYDAGMAGAKDVAAVANYMQQLPYVEPQVILIGQSAGGLVSVAAASQAIPGLRGVVNFAGGLRTLAYKGAPPGVWNLKDENNLATTYYRYGQTAQVPMLWIYTKNDSYFPSFLSPKLHAAFSKGGGNAMFYLLPPNGKDGHGFFPNKNNLPLWLPLFEQYLDSLGIPYLKEVA